MNFGDMKKWATGVKGQKAQILQAIEAKKRRREDLATLPMSRSDLLGFLERAVDQFGSAYPEALLGSVSHLVNKPLKRAVDLPHALQQLPILTAPGHGMAVTSPRPLEYSLAFLFAKEIKAGLRRAVDRMNLPVGPTLTEREREIGKLDAEISDLEKQLEQIVNEARDIVSDL